MNIQLSDRVSRIKPSPTLAITARANQLKAAGKDIISLGAGEPDFDTPDHIKEAAIKAIRGGDTKYTAVDGTPELKLAIEGKFARDNSLVYKNNQILVSCGGKHSFYNLSQALLNAGDEVIIPAPYWVSYPDMVLLADATPVIVATHDDNHFKMTPEQLEAAITPKTRVVVINSPSNPSGVAYRRAELEALGEVLLKYPDIIVATDDMYEHILWTNEPFCNIVNCCPDLYSRTVVLNGVSKAYSMTGWRIGYAAGPSRLIQAMSDIQSQSTSNPTSVAQAAAAAALSGDQKCVEEMRVTFKERHDYLVTNLNTIDGIRCKPSDGTFYAFPNVEAFIKRLPADMQVATDLDLAEFLLVQANVATVPGSAFGTPGHLRLSFATSMANLKKALERIGNINDR